MVRQIKNWIEKVRVLRTTRRKEEECMDIQVKQMPQIGIASEEFDKHTVSYEIKRIGKQIVIAGTQGAIPISKSNVAQLRNTVKSNKAIKVKTNGLSRAQLGRIVGDIKEDPTVSVYLRRTPTKKVTIAKPQAITYEILITDGSKR